MDDASRSYPQRRRWRRRLVWAAVWVASLLFFLVLQTALIEGGMRWAGYGDSTRFYLERVVEGRRYAVPNRAFYQQFTRLPLDRIMTWDDLDFQAVLPKPPDVCRIFVFGGSAVYGPRTSTRILEMMLAAYAPHVRWEVFNAACPGMNSHVMRAAARACARLEPDVFLVYMGNNEVVGPFGPATALGQSPLFWRPAVIRALIALNGLRAVQWLRGAGGDTLELPETDALMRALPGAASDERVLALYRRNLEDMLRSARSAGAAMLLCTLTGNRRFMGAEPTGPPASLPINDVIREVARGRTGVAVADVEAMLARHSIDGFPGYEYFVDNVHFNFDGNYLVARAMFEALLPLLPAWTRPASGNAATPLNRDACAAALAWTPAAEFELLRWQMQVFLDPFSGERVRARHAELHAQLGDDWKHQLVRDLRGAVKKRPADLLLRLHYFRNLVAVGDAATAREQATLLRELHPASRAAWRAQGIALEAAGDPLGARRAYEACLGLYPDDPEAMRRRAELLLREGKWAEARRAYARYLRYEFLDAFAFARYGETLDRIGDSRGARNAFEEALRLDPRSEFACRLMDEWLDRETPGQARTAFWDAFLRAHPDSPAANVTRGKIEMEAGNAAHAAQFFQQALAKAPNDREALLLSAQASLDSGDVAAAQAAIEHASGLFPDDPRVVELKERLELAPPGGVR